MSLVISNPLGWWGLLLIPAIILIHCLQRQRTPMRISTLFLIQGGAKERKGGRKFVFWRHSLTFWMQILAALILTWLLLQPRWIGEHTVQRIAYVLDSSLSMMAFKENLSEAMRESTSSFEKSASRTDWLLLESDDESAPLYRGNDREAFLHAVEKWEPRLGVHDWIPAIRTARALIEKGGVVVYVTDHPPAAKPYKMEVLSIGQSTDNVGFTGVQTALDFNGMTWRTLVKNYSDKPVSRTWWIEINGKKSEPRTADIPARGSIALGGIFPSGIRKMSLVLEDDPWMVDNRLPLVLPEAKGVAYQEDFKSKDTASTIRSLFQVIDETFRGTLAGKTDILVTESSDLQHSPGAAPNQILFLRAGESIKAPQGLISREDHPLNEGLNWNGLAVKGGNLAYTLKPGETPLAWLGSIPLIWIRAHANGHDLVFNFQVERTNALKLPATLLLINRFVEQVRENKPGYFAANVELGEPLKLVLPEGIETIQINGQARDVTGSLTLKAPVRPGFLKASQGESPLLRVAYHFADVREADLSGARKQSTVDSAVRELTKTNSVEDALQTWWLFLFLGVLTGSWYYAERGR